MRGLLSKKKKSQPAQIQNAFISLGEHFRQFCLFQLVFGGTSGIAPIFVACLRGSELRIKKLKNGMKLLPLPDRPETMPSKPPKAKRIFFQEKRCLQLHKEGKR